MIVVVVAASAVFYIASGCVGWFAMEFFSDLYEGRAVRPRRVAFAVVSALASMPFAWPDSVLL